MAKKKKTISIFSKLLLFTECSAVILLLFLCTYKNNIPVVSEILGETTPDVVLDAGHGGFDVGAINGDDYEKDINLSVVLTIGEKLEDAGYKVKYVRDDDTVDWASNESEDLAHRVKVSNESEAKLFVSVHVNSEEEDMGSYGYESWTNMNDPIAVNLSQNILNEVDTLDFSQNRGLRDQANAPLYVISQNTIPAILFEVGFIGSDNDQRYLLDETYQKQFSSKMADGIIKTLQEMQNE